MVGGECGGHVLLLCDDSLGCVVRRARRGGSAWMSCSFHLWRVSVCCVGGSY